MNMTLIHKDESYVRYSLDKMEERMAMVMFRKESMHLYMRFEKRYGTEKEECYLPFVQYAVEEAIKQATVWQCPTIIIEGYPFLGTNMVDSKEIRMWLAEKGVKLEESAIVAPHIERNFDFRKQDFAIHLAPNPMQKFFSFYTVFTDVINQKGQQEPTLTFEMINEHFDKNRKILFDLTYEGKRVRVFVWLELKTNTLHWGFNGEEHVLSLEDYDESVWRSTWQTFFEKAYKKQRLQSVYNLPQVYTKEGLLKMAEKETHSDQIKQQLLTSYSLRELENLFAKALKNRLVFREEIIISGKGSVVLASIGDHLFVYNTKEKGVRYFTTDEKEQALAYLHELAEKKQRESLEETIASFQNRLHVQNRKNKKNGVK